jgi:hypothetical protein
MSDHRISAASPSPTESDVERLPHKHDWSVWKVVGHTGDWFHPHILERTFLERTCNTCGEKERRDG